MDQILQCDEWLAMQWSGKRVIVTGGAGFLGSFVVEKLRDRGCQDVIVPRSKDYDLCDRDAIIRLYKEARPHVVIHLAAVVGGYWRQSSESRAILL